MTNIKSNSKKKMAIITSYFANESYGLLGPQMAASLIEDHTSYECIVIAVTRDDDKTTCKRSLSDYFGKDRPLVAFSSLSGREDLFILARELKEAGAFTLLAGPQADVDFSGEINRHDFPHHFQGLSRHFSCALHGPAEQSFALLQQMDTNGWRDTPGLRYAGADGTILHNPRQAWDERYFARVRWDNLYRPGESGIIPLKITSGQILQQIGCPHAAARTEVAIDYPAFLNTNGKKKVKISLNGCSFCDVAIDKGFQGTVSVDTVLSQIDCLPEKADGRKIPFELINENPLPGLSGLIKEISKSGIRLSQINLIMRADWFLKGESLIKKVLLSARDMDIRVVLSSVGFESFDESILRNLNKGLSVDIILRTIFLMRRLKEEFPDHLDYSRASGANHGFIHPTPWDSPAIAENIQRIIGRHSLEADILPNHSTPLIIHHASGLADWIREVEKREGCRFQRYGTIIGWWPEAVLLSNQGE